MKTKSALALFLIFLTVSCSNTKSEKQLNLINSNQVTIETGKNQIADLASETSPEKRLQILLTNSLNPPNAQSLEMVLELHTQNKISEMEFRTLFWNSDISSETLNIIQAKIEKDQNISVLDRKLISSLNGKTITFEELIEEIKKENAELLPAAMLSKITDIVVKVYMVDFDRINSDLYPIQYKLDIDDETDKSSFMYRLHKILELNFYKKMLSNQRLVSKKNPNIVEHREIHSEFKLDYSYSLGRLGRFDRSLKFENYEGLLGDGYASETPSIAQLSLFSKTKTLNDKTEVELLLNSHVQGGYDKVAGENATTTLDYTLTGSVIIPKCLNPAFCNQIAVVTTGYQNRSFAGSEVTNSGVSISVNGNNFENIQANSISVDISKNDAVINIKFTGSKKHIGACCVPKSTNQKLLLIITNDFINSNEPDFKHLIGFNAFDVSRFNPNKNDTALIKNDLNSMTKQVEILKAFIDDALPHKDTLDNYRYYLYSKLARIQKTIDYLMLKNASPLEILQERQAQSSLSDGVGRKLILPIINIKASTFQNSLLSYNRESINEMFKSILLLNLNSDNLKDSIKSIIYSRSGNLDEENKKLIIELLDSVNENAKDQKQLLSEIAKYQAEFNYLNKKMSLEMELLNLEKAQFAELNEEGKLIQ